MTDSTPSIRNTDAVPKQIAQQIRGQAFVPSEIGMSGSEVLLFEDRVLKIQEEGEEAENEVAVARWIAEGQKPAVTRLFPEILAYEVQGGRAFTLMSRIPGQMLCSAEYLALPPQLVSLAAEGLRKLWQLPADTERFTVSRLDSRLRAARYNVEHQKVDLEHVEMETFSENGFKNPEELLRYLEENRPEEDLVFTHGDYCLPNIFANPVGISGFIDLGKAGPADRWQDLALCLRSLRDNTNGRFGLFCPGCAGIENDLLNRLGIPMDEKKYRYYLLLDELF